MESEELSGERQVGMGARVESGGWRVECRVASGQWRAKSEEQRAESVSAPWNQRSVCQCKFVAKAAQHAQLQATCLDKTVCERCMVDQHFKST